MLSTMPQSCHSTNLCTNSRPVQKNFNISSRKKLICYIILKSFPIMKNTKQYIMHMKYYLPPSKLLQTHRPVTFPTATVFPVRWSISYELNINLYQK